MFGRLLIIVILLTAIFAKEIQEEFLHFFNKVNAQPAYPWAEENSGTRAPIEKEEDSDNPTQFVNEEKTKLYASELAGYSQAVQSYGNAYTEYLARQGQYQQELLEAKEKAMDALRREHYVDEIKQMRDAYNLENNNQPKGSDNTIGGRLLTEPIDAYKSEKPAPIRGQDKPISRPDEIDILLLKRFNINVNDLQARDIRALKRIRSYLVKNQEKAAEEGIDKLFDNIPGDIRRNS